MSNMMNVHHELPATDTYLNELVVVSVADSGEGK